MKVKDLIKELQAIKNQDADVLVSSDSGGNVIRFLEDISEGHTYDPDDVAYNIVECLFLSELEKGYSEEDILTVEDGGKECVVFY